MGPGYTLEELPIPVKRNGSMFHLVIRRNFATTMERSGAAVFYFLESQEASECLDKLLAQ